MKKNGGRSIEVLLASKAELDKIFRITQKFLPQFSHVPSDIKEELFLLKEKVEALEMMRGIPPAPRMVFSKNLLNHFVNMQGLPFSTIGNMANVSGEAVRKRCEKMQISKKKKPELKFHVTKTELNDLVHKQKLSWADIGRKFNVASTSIKKRCKKLGVPTERMLEKKNKKKRSRVTGTGQCTKCQAQITKRAQLCVDCEIDARPKKFEITKEELYDLVHVQKMNYCAIGKQFGVSDNAIRKRCRLLGVEVRKRNQEKSSQ